MASKKQSALDLKIAQIMKEGVRMNTHAPVSKTNPRRPVSQAQAVAIARSMMGMDNKKTKKTVKKTIKKVAKKTVKKSKFPKRLFAFRNKKGLTKNKV